MMSTLKAFDELYSAFKYFIEVIKKEGKKDVIRIFRVVGYVKGFFKEERDNERNNF
jgi:hypothetical protein